MSGWEFAGGCSSWKSLRAEVAVMNSYSAHADEPELIDFIGKMDRDRLKNIFLVHGDIQRQELLRTALNKEGYSDVLIPDKGDSYDL